jgi:hypothetical protein
VNRRYRKGGTTSACPRRGLGEGRCLRQYLERDQNRQNPSLPFNLEFGYRYPNFRIPRGISALSAKIAWLIETEGVLPRIPWDIKILADYNPVNVVKSTLALLHYRECEIARRHTALKTLAVGR